MLLEKYSPKATKDLFNQSAVSDVRHFLSGWRKGKAMLVHGPTGSGKSVSIKLIARELGYGLVESYANEERNVKSFTSSSVESGIFSKKRLILLEDVETMQMRGVADLIKNSNHPVICTVTDAYSLSQPVRKSFKLVKFEKIRDADLLKFLEEVCREENISMSKRDMDQLVRSCNGDIRSLLIDLDVLRLGRHDGYRDIEDNIFSTLRTIFKSMSIENSRIALHNSEKNIEDLFRWIGNNISEEYTDIETIATALNYLSKADMFRSRIVRRQSWSLEKYFSDLTVYGTSLAKTRPSVRMAMYKPPFYFGRNTAGLEKLATALHVSKKQAAAYIPIVRMLVKINSTICEDIGMDENEISAVIG